MPSLGVKGSIRAGMSALTRAALPCAYGLAVVPTADYAEGGFRGQVDGPDVKSARVVLPGSEDLIEWVKSCLELDGFSSCGAGGPLDGWSPGRSVAVRVVYVDGASLTHETFYYRCMDQGRSDVRVFGVQAPGCFRQWVSVWRKFLILAWNVLHGRGIATARVGQLIDVETAAWSSYWVRVVVAHLRASSGPPPAMAPREYIREWSFSIIKAYEDNLRRLCVSSVFAEEPLHVLYLLQHSLSGGWVLRSE